MSLSIITTGLVQKWEGAGSGGGVLLVLPWKGRIETRLFIATESYFVLSTIVLRANCLGKSEVMMVAGVVELSVLWRWLA